MSVEFDPVGVGPRRRRFDPLAIGVVAVVIALAAAVVKPWDSAGDTIPSASPVAAAAPSALSSLLPAATATPSPTRPAPAEPPTGADFASVVKSHEGWGVQTIARRQTPPWSLDRATYLEDWSPTTIDADGSQTVRARAG